jgi:hypothetical protein
MNQERNSTKKSSRSQGEIKTQDDFEEQDEHSFDGVLLDLCFYEEVQQLSSDDY